jgi:hypothetical protein
MSYDRMVKEEVRLQAEVDVLLQQATEADALDDARYGRDRTGDELPGDLAFREGRLRKICEAKAALEQEAREARALEGTPPWAETAAAVPAPTAQRNFTDPESRIMPASGDKESFVQAYTCQAVVDATAQIVIAADVTQAPNDKQQTQPLLQQAIANTGQVPKTASLDAGYYSEHNVHVLTALGCMPLIPPDRPPHERTRPVAPRGRIPLGLSVADRMRLTLRTKRGATPVRQTESHGRAGLRSDQAGTRVPAVLIAGPSPRPRRMGADLCDPQRAEALEDHPPPTSAIGLQSMSGVKRGSHGTRRLRESLAVYP